MSTYRLEEIVQRTGLTPRAVRYYVQLGLLPGAKPRGVSTVYSHEQLVRLLAIPLLRKRERLRLAGVKRRLRAMSLAEVEALVEAVGATPVIGAADSQTRGAATGNAGAENANSSTDQASYPSTRWEHVELLPGLELRVRGDAGAIVRRLAQEIFTQYGVAAPLRAGSAPSMPDPAGVPRSATAKSADDP